MLQKMAHPPSRLESKVGSVQKCQIFQDFPKFRGNHGQSISIEKWPLSISNRGSELAKCWEKPRPPDETENVAENGPF